MKDDSSNFSTAKDESASSLSSLERSGTQFCSIPGMGDWYGSCTRERRSRTLREKPLIAMVVGHFQLRAQEEIQAAAQRAGAQCVFVSEVGRAATLMRSLDAPPRCVFVSIKEDVSGLAEHLRDSVDYYTIPLIAFVPFPGDEFYQLANRQGADDCIPEYDTGGVTRRLANLAQGEAPRLPDTRSGRALVAISDEKQRRHVGRRLRSAGYEVEFISSRLDFDTRRDSGAQPSLLVATPSFPPVIDQPEDECVEGEDSLPRITVPDWDGDPLSPRQLSAPEIGARLMFLVDEATRPVLKDARASRRIQHSVIATFSEQRTFEHTYGLTDNLSRQGLYMRTLDPPPVGSSVRVNLRDKYHDILQIRGLVAWRYAPSQVGGRICPGFGLSIAEESCPRDDLEKYHALYGDVLTEVESVEDAGKDLRSCEKFLTRGSRH